MENKRSEWSSNFGFIIASAGSAIGLGNIWKFPYMAGNNGGGAFVFVYLTLVMVVGFALILSEVALGRYTKQSALGAYSKINKHFKFIGYLNVLAAFFVLCTYNVLGSFIIGYVMEYLTSATFITTFTPEVFYDELVSSQSVILWQISFIFLTSIIVINGISGGIEKVSKICMPLLIVMFITIMVKCLSLPGSEKGVEFFLKPDFSKINLNLILDALGQVFFSLSLGMGVNITFGSYLNKESNIFKNSFLIPFIDTIVALIAGLTILPAVFAFGLNPEKGSSLIFVTLPTVFENMAFGNIFGFLFFLLIFFATITSSVAIFEVCTSSFMDKFNISRKLSVFIIALISLVVTLPAILSFSTLGHIEIFSYTIFEFFEILPTKYLLPLGGLLLCLVVGHTWGIRNVSIEVFGKRNLCFEIILGSLIKLIIPIGLIIVFVKQFV